MSKIDNTYHELLTKIKEKGFRYEDPNRKDVYRIQIPHAQIEHNFVDGFPAITTKKLYWKGVVGELLWFLRGDTHIKYLVDNNINIWNKDAYNWFLETQPTLIKSWGGKPNQSEIIKFDKNNKSHFDLFKGCILNNEIEGDLGRVYGAQWREWGKFSWTHPTTGIITKNSLDQISNLIKGLKETPMSTQHIVTAWNPAELDNMALPPCHWSFEILVEPLTWHQRIDILSNLPKHLNAKYKHANLDEYNIPKYTFTLKWHQRSVDTFLGLPFNIASYALLAHIIGKMTNMIPKSIIGDLSNVHIYEPHMDAVDEQLSRSTNFVNSRCDLEMYIDTQLKIYENENNLDKFLNSLDIHNFKLSSHMEQPAIKAEMLPYNK